MAILRYYHAQSLENEVFLTVRPDDRRGLDTSLKVFRHNQQGADDLASMLLLTGIRPPDADDCVLVSNGND